ncbi:MAG: hypothetical protein DMD60_12150 [Gemmatimonadetes bacterium]|nr:MAG: hypothetical protein DMD60_12150 [Gemmatimonadota bacterium]
MTDPLLLLQAAADTSRAYGEFPVIGARAFVWITAEVHLMFAAFVLGVPMFAVVTEAIGIFGGDERYDRLSKEFTRLLLVAYSATAIWGAMLVFGLSTLYPCTSITMAGTAGKKGGQSWATGHSAFC